MLHVTRHAAQRYTERVEPVNEEDARRALQSPAVARAIAFAGDTECCIRLANSQRICIRDGVVITVLPAENYKSHIRRVGRGRYG